MIFYLFDYSEALADAFAEGDEVVQIDIRAEGEVERDRLENLEEFLTGAIEYENNYVDDGSYASALEGFMEETALVADVDRYDESADAVVLMTAHSAKGLEFPVVFIAGMEDGIFPGYQSIMSNEELEEENEDLLMLLMPMMLND